MFFLKEKYLHPVAASLLLLPNAKSLSTGNQTVRSGTSANVWKNKCTTLHFPLCIVSDIQLFLIILKNGGSYVK